MFLYCFLKSKEDSTSWLMKIMWSDFNVREVLMKHSHAHLLCSVCGCFCTAAKPLQLCPTLSDPIDGSPPGSSNPGGAGLEARFSRQEYWSGLPFPSPVHARMLSCFSRVRLCATLWTAAHQAPLSTGFSRQEHWSGLPFPSPAFALH